MAPFTRITLSGAASQLPEVASTVNVADPGRAVGPDTWFVTSDDSAVVRTLVALSASFPSVQIDSDSQTGNITARLTVKGGRGVYVQRQIGGTDPRIDPATPYDDIVWEYRVADGSFTLGSVWAVDKSVNPELRHDITTLFRPRA